MNVLVTGGAGFIGSHLAGRLRDLGHDVTVVDDLSNGYVSNIPEGVGFIEMDLADSSKYFQLPSNIDVVYHLASQASGEMSCEAPVLDLKSNAMATLALLQWSKLNDVEKFIFTSSMGIYEDRQMSPVTERSPKKPQSFYGVNKLASEEFIRIYSEEGLDTTVLRFFNVYGPGQNMENLKQGMVSIYMSYVLDGVPVSVKGPLDRTRDFTYVDDAIEALLLSLNPEAKGQTFNVCTGRELSVNDVLKTLFSAFGQPEDYPVDILPRTPRDIDRSCGDFDHIQNVLGWKAKVSFEDGVQLMIDWVKGRN